jgi:hypothetical protein
MKTNHNCIQIVPGVVSTAGFNYRANYESDISCAHGSDLQWFRSNEHLQYINPYPTNVENMASS